MPIILSERDQAALSAVANGLLRDALLRLGTQKDFTDAWTRFFASLALEIARGKLLVPGRVLTVRRN